MKKILLSVGIVTLAIVFFAFGDKSIKSIGQYVGTQQCGSCHSTIKNQLAQTMHAKIHLPAIAANVRPTWTGSVSMGASYSNASVALVMNGATYQVTLTPTSGAPVTYDVVYTYGYGWKQRYLVKIENSYYIPPIQYNLNKYLDNSSGAWVTYNPQKWFNADGTIKAFNNSFRKTSWDKNCESCHITGNRVSKSITGVDTAWVSNWANTNSNLNMTVGCESCHGPGSFHVSTNSPNDIYGPTRLLTEPLARQQEMCGQCHSRSASTADTYEFPWNEATDSSYYPGQVLANFYVPWNLHLNSVGGPGTWIDTITSRQHHQQWQEMSYSGHANNQNCYEKCHDPHKNTAFRHQLKQDPDNNDICIQCHSTFGTIGSPDITAIMAHTKHSYDPTNINQTGGSSRCVNCHMAAAATSAKAYDIHSHHWKVIKPIKTLLYKGITGPGGTLGILNSCAVSCHRNPSTTNGTANVPTFGIATDATLTNWSQSTDSILADTLNRWFNNQVWTQIRTLSELSGIHSLGQNFPNPFQSKTQISFTIPTTEFVTIKVYDLTGREVAFLVNAQMEQGTYSVNFDVTNLEQSSNIYFYQIKAGTFTQTKKMICLK